MIDHAVVDETLPGARTRSVKNDIVQRDGIEIACETGVGPRCQLFLPVLFWFRRDCCFYALQVLLAETVAESGEDVLLGSEIKVESALGDVRARGDLLNRCR